MHASEEPPHEGEQPLLALKERPYKYLLIDSLYETVQLILRSQPDVQHVRGRVLGRLEKYLAEESVTQSLQLQHEDAVQLITSLENVKQSSTDIIGVVALNQKHLLVRLGSVFTKQPVQLGQHYQFFGQVSLLSNKIPIMVVECLSEANDHNYTLYEFMVQQF